MIKETISYDEFSKLDIRIGTIREVEVVEGADKLLKLTVDFGDDGVRTIVSGIREHVGEGQELVGRQTTFVLNLEPRVIRDIESQGMLFAVGGAVGLAFLHPDHEVPVGSPLI